MKALLGALVFSNVYLTQNLIVQINVSNYLLTMARKTLKNELQLNLVMNKNWAFAIQLYGIDSVLHCIITFDEIWILYKKILHYISENIFCIMYQWQES